MFENGFFDFNSEKPTEEERYEQLKQICFKDGNEYIVRGDITTTDTDLFGMPKGPCNIEIGTVNFECGTGLSPKISQLKYGVRDVDGRLHGTLKWHKPWGEQEFPAVCTESFKIEQF